jgi:hypothetical protein
MWDWAVWTALIVGAVAAIAGFALLLSRSLSALRAFTETRRTLVGGLDAFAAKAGAAADKLADADDTPELQESLARLRVSLARLAVLQAAIDEVDLAVGRAIAVVPHK